MPITLTGKLMPTPEQHQTLLETIKTINAASNWLSPIVREKRTVNKIALQKVVYQELKERFNLPAQYAVRVIARVCNAYKTLPKKSRFDKTVEFSELSAIDLDQRLLAFKGIDRVSLATIKGRIVVPIIFGRYFLSRIGFRRGHAKLIYRRDINAFFIAVAADVPEEEMIDPKGWLGVDVGIANIATDSLGNFYGGQELIAKREHMKEFRRQLQRKKAQKRRLGKSDRSVQRALKRLSKRLRNYTRTVMHTIAKRIVSNAKALALGIALEDLKGIGARTTVKVRRDERYQHSLWAYRLLQQCIAYKAHLSGVPVVFVDARYSSQTCPHCGFRHRKNRPSQSEFRCRQCGYSAHADFIAALNLALRAQAVVSQPQMLGGFYPRTGKPPASAGGC
jgi:IS605 OrfB family transposase